MSKIDLHKKLLVNMYETYIEKNSDYGDAFGITYSKLGIPSALTRISDKYLRLENLILNGNQKVKEESIQDTLMDLANYCLMTLIEMEKSNE